MRSQLAQNLKKLTPRDRPIGRPCPCVEGYSQWHVVALGLVESRATIQAFALEVMKQKSDTLLDDLRESTCGFLSPHFELQLQERHGVGWGELNPCFRYRTVAELCALAGRPLFGFWDLNATYIHPVVAAFNASMLKQKNQRQ